MTDEPQFEVHHTGSASASQKTIEELRAAGVPVQVIHPPGGDMYSMVFNPDKELVRSIVGTAELAPEWVPRGRDAWLERHDDKLVAAVYTRAGGANRADYPEHIAVLRSRPNYISDNDDIFDSTYATFRFEITPEGIPPEAFLSILAGAHEGPVDTDERWKDAIEKLTGERP